MAFELNMWNGYVKGERYEKPLHFDRMFGNARKRYIVMIDDNGNELIWLTNDYTKAYKEFVARGVYKFTITSILNLPDKKDINIGHLKFVHY